MFVNSQKIARNRCRINSQKCSGKYVVYFIADEIGLA